MRVVLVAGEPVFRLGFRSLLSSSEDLQLVGDAPDARSGFALIDAEQPDLVAEDLLKAVEIILSQAANTGAGKMSALPGGDA